MSASYPARPRSKCPKIVPAMIASMFTTLAMFSVSPAPLHAQRPPASLPTLLKIPAPAQFSDVLISPSGKFVLRSREDGLDILSVATGRGTQVAQGTTGGLAWSPAGDRIAWSVWDGEPKRPTVWTMTVDPVTAAPRGAAQRVSADLGDTPAISHDGKWIAYATFPEGTARNATVSQRRILVVPVTGGPERLITRTESYVSAIYWSRDDKSLFLGDASPDGKHSALSRVALSDGILRVLSRDSVWVAGMTSDGMRLVMMPWGMAATDNSFATIVDTAGRTVGSVKIPLGQRIFYGGVVGDTALMLVRWEDRWGIETRRVDGTRVRSLPIVGMSNIGPRYAPKGDLLSFAVDQMGRKHLAISKADGTAPREFPTSSVRNDSYFGTSWSPDGRHVAFQSGDRKTLSVLDVTTGQSRVLITGAVSTGFMQWRPDGTGLAVFVPGQGVQSITLSGERRTLVADSLFSQMRGGALRATSAGFAVRSDSALTLHPYDGGTAREVRGLPVVGGTTSALSADGATLAVLLRGNGSQRVELFSLATLARRTIDLPFQIGAGNDAAFADGGKLLLAIGSRPNDTGRFVFGVPLDGGRPYPIGPIDSFQPFATLTVSPDGKLVSYAAQRTAERSLVLLDLRSVLRSPAAGRGTR